MSVEPPQTKADGVSYFISSVSKAFFQVLTCSKSYIFLWRSTWKWDHSWKSI